MTVLSWVNIHLKRAKFLFLLSSIDKPLERYVKSGAHSGVILHLIIDSIYSHLKRWCQTLIHQLLVELVSKCMEYKSYIIITLFVNSSKEVKP